MNTATMKRTMAAVAASMACVVSAMPTADEIKTAGNEIRGALTTQISAWQKGDILNSDMAALMLLMADRYDKTRDAARHYVCLQASFAAAAKAGDAALAAKSLAAIRTDTAGFSETREKALVDKALSGIDAKAAAEFRQKLNAALVAAPGGLDAASLATIARMKEIIIPELSIKPSSATLADAIAAFAEESARHGDPTLPKGKRGVFFLIAADGSDDPSKTPVQPIRARNLSLFNMLELLCQASGVTFRVKNGIVIVGTEKAFSKTQAAERPVVTSDGDESSDRAVAFLKRTAVPSVSFNKAPLREVIGWFREESQRHDDPTLPEDKRGVSFLLDFGDRAAALSNAPVTFSSENVSLYDSLTIVCNIAGCVCEVRDGVATIVPKPETSGE